MAVICVLMDCSLKKKQPPSCKHMGWKSYAGIYSRNKDCSSLNIWTPETRNLSQKFTWSFLRANENIGVHRSVASRF